ncbi:MAG: FAD-binding oxidoreductase, partial [Thaumarchaeota archaeon]|nr:FAD-binding oxidoreductase [Nitrososphaerota archaeon]
MKSLADIVGDRWVSDEQEVLASYGRDISTYLLYGQPKPPDLVILPQTTDEISQIVKYAKANHLIITIRNTGLSLSSTSVAGHGGLLIDLRRMDRVLQINGDTHTATVEPNVSLAVLSFAMQKRGMFIAIPGAPSTAGVLSNYVYGNTNKSGSRLDWQYNHIIGIEMVLPDGSIIKTGSSADNSDEPSIWA